MDKISLVSSKTQNLSLIDKFLCLFSAQSHSVQFIQGSGVSDEIFKST